MRINWLAIAVGIALAAIFAMLSIPLNGTGDILIEIHQLAEVNQEAIKVMEKIRLEITAENKVRLAALALRMAKPGPFRVNDLPNIEFFNQITMAKKSCWTKVFLGTLAGIYKRNPSQPEVTVEDSLKVMAQVEECLNE